MEQEPLLETLPKVYNLRAETGKQDLFIFSIYMKNGTTHRIKNKMLESINLTSHCRPEYTYELKHELSKIPN